MGSTALTRFLLVRYDDNDLYIVAATELGDESDAIRASRPTDDGKAEVEQCRSIRLTFGDKKTRVAVKGGWNEQPRATANNTEFPAIRSSEPQTDRVVGGVSHRKRVGVVIPRPSSA